MTEMRAFHLVKRPEGLPGDDCFALREQPLPPLEDGQILVSNRWLSVDPYMRGRMNDRKSYVPPFQLDQPMEGGAIGAVVECRSPDFKPGDMVSHMLGWRDIALMPAKAATRLPETDAPPQAFLGILGLTGATAYFGLLNAASMKQGDIVFVSGAAGAVGSAAVQIAKLKGASRVIGSAGGAAKTAWLKEIGCDAAIDYKAEPDLVAALRAAASKGIDVYFDNVSGDHLSAALACARPYARFAECGMIEAYNDTEPGPGIANMIMVVGNRIRIQGFIVTDYAAEMARFHQEMGGWVARGQIRSRETVRDGLEAMPQAFRDLFSGGNIGKMLVRL